MSSERSEESLELGSFSFLTCRDSSTLPRTQGLGRTRSECLLSRHIEFPLYYSRYKRSIFAFYVRRDSSTLQRTQDLGMTRGLCHSERTEESLERISFAISV